VGGLVWLGAVVIDSSTAIRSTHCNTLQHIATHCNTLQHTATHKQLDVGVVLVVCVCVCVCDFRNQLHQADILKSKKSYTPFNILKNLKKNSKVSSVFMFKTTTALTLEKLSFSYAENENLIFTIKLQNTLQHTASHCNTLQHTATAL